MVLRLQLPLRDIHDGVGEQHAADGRVEIVVTPEECTQTSGRDEKVAPGFPESL
jgi:hypothetical protein